MTYMFKTLIIAAIGATSLAAHTTMASAMDGSDRDQWDIDKNVTTPTITQRNTVATFIKADTQTKPRGNAVFLLQK